MGLASAWALQRAGRDVVVLEQFDVGNDRGSSHGAARIFRFAYDEPDWVALAQEALPLWRELEGESGQAILSLTGAFLATPIVQNATASDLPPTPEKLLLAASRKVSLGGR